MLDLLPDVSFFIKDRQGRFVALNRLACEFCGVRSEQEAIGKNDWDLFPPARVPAYLADDQSVLESGQPILNRLEPTPQMEGAPHLIVTNKVALRDPQGQVIGVAGFSRRVTQVQTAGEALRRLAAAVESLHRDYAQALTSAGLASLAGLSVSQFERTFRKLLGTTPRQYLLRVRVTQACRLLAETSRTVATLALECGFYDQAHFTRAFKAQMGVSPSAYREEQQRPQP
ncbi:MAG: HTH-type transcriptional activator RhaS [Verrucomicrobiota bacterium]